VWAVREACRSPPKSFKIQKAEKAQQNQKPAFRLDEEDILSGKLVVHEVAPQGPEFLEELQGG
jgi:hypothetical protein